MSNPCLDLIRRPRRNRRSPQIRALFTETTCLASHLIQPLFCLPNPSARQPIDSLPEMERLGLHPLLKECERLQKLNLGGVALFPVFPPEAKSEQGDAAIDPHNFFYTLLRTVKHEFPDFPVFVDVALDPYTTHGHDGLLNEHGEVDNDPTVERLCRLACLLAETGVEYVAPSDMMDGRILAIRQTLDANGFQQTGILAYAAKFASASYGPFRDAVTSALPGDYLDKKTYQLNPANSREALEELKLDELEGADVLMVKPAGWYGDILARARKHTRLPLAAYQVSGEYAMIHAAARQQWLSLRHSRHESLLSLRRAGADLIFTYFAGAWADENPA